MLNKIITTLAFTVPFSALGQGETFPDMGFCVPNEVEKLVVHEYERGVSGDDFFENHIESYEVTHKVKYGTKLYGRFFDGVTSMGVTIDPDIHSGFIVKGRHFVADINYREICAYDKNGELVIGKGYPENGCFSIYGNKAIRAHKKANVRIPYAPGGTMIIKHLNAIKDPTVCMNK